MARYFFALNNDLPEKEAAEDPPTDAAARELAISIAIGICRNREREPAPVCAYNEQGQCLGKTLTGEDDETTFEPAAAADV